MQTRGDFGKLVNGYYQTGWGAEIGVNQAWFSAMYMKDWTGHAYLVDPWAKLPDYKSPLNEGDFEARIAIVLRNMQPYEGRYVVLRMRSDEAAQKIQDGALDWVYIDANHDYQHVAQDLSLWVPKVRNGGVVAGHDYLAGLYWGEDVGVKPAVDEFIATCGKELVVTNLDIWQGYPVPTWWFIK